MDNMIKFYRGLVSNLPATGVSGALYITTDEGAIYYGTGDGMKRLGDFIQVANVAALPEKAHESCLYYCVAENILAKWNGSEWKQINKQPTAEELKGLLGLGSLAYLSEVGEDNLSSVLKEKVNAAAEGNHSHSNKALLDTYTQTEANLADAVAKKHAHTFNETELNKIVEGDVAKWNAAEGNAKSYVDEKIGALDFTDTAVDGEYVSAVNEVDGKISVTRKALPDYTNVYEVKGEAAKVQGELNTYKEANDIALANVKATADAAYVKPVTGIAKTDLAADVQTSLGKADTALQSHQDISHLAVKSEVNTELGKKVDVTAYNTKVGELETAIGGKVDKVTGKSLVLDTEITKLAGVSEGANKVEGSTVNGKIKIDGVETVVYTHPEKHAIADVDGLQGALDGKQAAGNYSEVGHKHVKEDITDFAHTHTKSEITDFAHTHVASEITNLDATIKGYNYATKAEAQGYADAKDGVIAEAKQAGLDAQASVNALAGKVGEVGEGQTVMGIIKNIQENAYNDKELRDLISGNTEAIGTKVAQADYDVKVKALEDAIALKADKSVVDGMYTNAQIDGFIAEAKKYADDNDANTTYTIGYESKVEGEDGHPARIVLTPSEGEVQYVDATPFIKDGMISNVVINEDNDLVITFNTDAGKEAIEIPLDEFIDVYTGSTGARVTVGVEGNVISADLVAGSIGKDYLDEGVKASLGLADTALQAHQNISHLATKEELNGIDGKFANYTNTTDLNAALELKADKTQVATDIGTAKQEAIEAAKVDAANKSAVVLAEAQTYADGKVKALAEGQVATNKNDIASIIEMLTWGSF